jgi:hypothetical protein
MLRSSIKFLPVLLCAILQVSCGFVDLRPVGITVEPGESGALLSEPYTPVVLRFDTEMEKNDAEGILQISTESGVVIGDRFWEGNDLYFVPTAGWTAGIRHVLSLSGTIRTVDSRELRLERFISFYAINTNEPPLLEFSSPTDCASIGTGNFVLELRFSRSMDRLTVESALILDGIGNKTFEWSANDTILRVISDNALSPWTSYRWSLKDSAKSIDGVPLPKTYSAQFITDLDTTFPKVEKVYPVQKDKNRWFPTGRNIANGLESGNGIAIEFSKTMGESILRSVRFDPSLTGRAELLSEKSIVYIFSGDPKPETTYTLIISGDTKDSEGLKIGADYRINFVPDIPYLNLLPFFADEDSGIMKDFSETNNPIKIPVDSATKEISFTLRFSLPFTSNEEKQNAALKISLSHFFPGTLASAALRNVLWIGNDRLQMIWEGLEAGNDNEPHYYKLTIPGGKSGISCGNGIYMKEDITIILEATE